MLVTWTVPIRLKDYKGQQVNCRNEAEAAKLILLLILSGVKRHQIIVDGVRQERINMNWVFEAIEA